jgi:IclR family pca regulon transcriptional regulator
MSVLDGDEVVYVARVPTRRIMAIVISVGTRFPAFATSMGRVLLAGRGDEWLDGYLSSVQLAPLTPKTITDPRQLRSELMRVRREGWALIDEELEEGLRSIAAPVQDHGGNVIAAVNVSAPTSRGAPETLRDELLPHLLAAVARVEDDIRYMAPMGSTGEWRV